MSAYMNPSEQSALEVIRQRLRYLLTGTGAPAAAQANSAGIVAALDASIDVALARQTWQPGHPEHGNVYGQPITHGQFTFAVPYWRPLEKMVRMWGCPFSRHYHNPVVLEHLIAGLRFGERHTRPDQPRDGSWFSWDIWFPQVYCVLLILLEDQLPADLRTLMLEDLAYMPSKVFSMDRDHGITRPPITSGFNNLEVLYHGLLRGLILNDPQWITTVMQQLPIAMGRVPGGEGLQNDWSYHFHGPGVNVGYGLGSLIMQGQWLYLVQGTPWQVPDTVRELQIGMVREFFARNMWRGRVAPYSTDRGIVTPGAIYARSYLTGILFGLNTDFSPQDQAVFAAATADYLQSPEPKKIPTAGPAVAPDPFSMAGDLLEGLLRSKIQHPLQADLSVLGGMRYYPDSQYLLVREPTWFAAVRMSSGRTSTWKSMLGYNLYGSSTAEFSIALMTDGREYDDTTIPTMNWKRLMGVTRCDVIEPPPEGFGQSAFCGGLAGDEFAVLGLQYLLAPAGQDTLRGNKSVFATPNALVLLGSQIKCDSATPVVTTLFHAPVITDDGQYRRNDAPLDVRQDGTWEIKAGETLQLRNISIRLLTDAQLIVETRRGSYADLNMREIAPKPTPATAAYYAMHERRWVYLVVNHGVRPANSRYGAVITAGKPAALQIVHEDGHHRVAMSDGSTGGEVRFPGDWRKPIGSSYWGAEQHQWGSIARWTPSDDPGYANLEITPPARFVRGSENANTEIFLPDGFVQENVTLKTYAGQPFPANLISLPAKGQVLKLRVRRVAAG